jgi:hypothetical protein
VPQTKPETSQNARTLVLPEMPQRKRVRESMKILFLHSGLSASALVEVGTDHRLADPEPLAGDAQSV